MSSTLTFPTSGRAGQTIVWHLSNEAGQKWNKTGTPAFENVSSAHQAAGNYDLTTSEAGGSGVSGVFTGTMPAAAAGRYRADAFVEGVYTVPVSEEEWFYWDGTSLYLGGATAAEVAAGVRDISNASPASGSLGEKVNQVLRVAQAKTGNR